MKKLFENNWFKLGFVTALVFLSLGAGSQLALNKGTGLALLVGFLWMGFIIYFMFKMKEK